MDLSRDRAFRTTVVLRCADVLLRAVFFVDFFTVLRADFFIDFAGARVAFFLGPADFLAEVPRDRFTDDLFALFFEAFLAMASSS